MSDEVLDLPEFLERVQDDKELLLELFDIYQEDYIEKRTLMEEAVKTNNIEEVKSLAHSLKGASGNISAKCLHKLFFQLEDKGKNNDLTGSDAVLVDVDVEYERLSARITEIREEFSS